MEKKRGRPPGRKNGPELLTEAQWEARANERARKARIDTQNAPWKLQWRQKHGFIAELTTEYYPEKKGMDRVAHRLTPRPWTEEREAMYQRALAEGRAFMHDDPPAAA